jgi:hypothetical protein
VDLVKLPLGFLTDFLKGELDVSRLNYGVITLVPNGPDVDNIFKFTILLLNVTLKLLMKVLLNIFKSLRV